MSTREELEARLLEKEAKLDEARAEQAEKDEIAVLEAKLEHELHDLSVMRLQRYAPGLPTLLIVRKPDSAQYKRWRDLLLRGDRAKALGFLSKDCLLYPSAEVFGRLAQVFPELPDQVAVVGAELAKGGAEQEGKS
jgi:hypothetical protein